jgi:hypothetical protein
MAVAGRSRVLLVVSCTATVILQTAVRGTSGYPYPGSPVCIYQLLHTHLQLLI